MKKILFFKSDFFRTNTRLKEIYKTEQAFWSNRLFQAHERVHFEIGILLTINKFNYMLIMTPFKHHCTKLTSLNFTQRNIMIVTSRFASL